MITGDTDLQALLQRIIQDSFPDLLSEKITVNFVEEKNSDFFLHYGTIGDAYYIVVSDRMYKANEDAFIGGLVHELCHIARKRGWLDDILYNHYRIYRFLDERNTDLDGILRGYGNQLAAFELFAHNRRTTVCEGLTLLEFKRMGYLK